MRSQLEQIISSSGVSFVSLALRRTGTDGMFINDKIDDQPDMTPDALISQLKVLINHIRIIFLYGCLYNEKFSSFQSSVPALDPTMAVPDVDQVMSSFIEDIAARRARPVCAMNFAGDSMSFLPCALKDMPYNIDPARNPLGSEFVQASMSRATTFLAASLFLRYTPKVDI